VANVIAAMEYAVKIDREAIKNGATLGADFDKIYKWSFDKNDAQENAIVFTKETGEWVMRITQDCISVNDNVSTDDAAEAVVAAIGRYLNKSKWIGLTDEELRQCIGIGTEDSDWNVAVVQEWLRKVEAKLKGKNGG